ncbi:MAG TPA: hypothetical protein GX693_07755 [Firmicutes bacterium]|nr:hypothetical protein [Bacillota bacterium]
MKIWDQIKEVLAAAPGKETGRASKSFYQKLLVLLLLGIGLLWLGTWFSSGKEQQVFPAAYEQTGEQETRRPGEQALIQELTEMIGQIKGVNNVKIFITLESGSRLELVTDEERTSRQTLEEDSGGGSREIVEENTSETHVILRDNQGQELPLVVQEFQPCYRGVLVVAEGVENPVVKEQVVEALKAVLNLSYHRITVLPRGD